jgi:hypothetical protein
VYLALIPALSIGYGDIVPTTTVGRDVRCPLNRHSGRKPDPRSQKDQKATSANYLKWPLTRAALP